MLQILQIFARFLLISQLVIAGVQRRDLADLIDSGNWNFNVTKVDKSGGGAVTDEDLYLYSEYYDDEDENPKPEIYEAKYVDKDTELDPIFSQTPPTELSTYSLPEAIRPIANFEEEEDLEAGTTTESNIEVSTKQATSPEIVADQVSTAGNSVETTSAQCSKSPNIWNIKFWDAFVTSVHSGPEPPKKWRK